MLDQQRPDPPSARPPVQVPMTPEVHDDQMLRTNFICDLALTPLEENRPQRRRIQPPLPLKLVRAPPFFLLKVYAVLKGAKHITIQIGE